MKPVIVLAASALVSATAAWAHPGHGATGPYHHLADLLALGAIAVVLGIIALRRRKGDKDHD